MALFDRRGALLWRSPAWLLHGHKTPETEACVAGLRWQELLLTKDYERVMAFFANDTPRAITFGCMLPRCDVVALITYARIYPLQRDEVLVIGNFTAVEIMPAPPCLAPDDLVEAEEDESRDVG